MKNENEKNFYVACMNHKIVSTLIGCAVNKNWSRVECELTFFVFLLTKTLFFIIRIIQNNPINSSSLKKF